MKLFMSPHGNVVADTQQIQDFARAVGLTATESPIPLPRWRGLEPAPRFKLKQGGKFVGFAFIYEDVIEILLDERGV